MRMQEASALRTCLVGRVLLARAFTAPTVPQLSLVLREVAAASRSVEGRLLYWPVLPEEAEVPSPEVREAMQRATSTLLSYCEAVTVIVPGRGLKPTLMRSALRAMTLVAGHAGRVRVAVDLSSAVEAARDPDVQLAPIERAARELGIFGARSVPSTRAER